MVGRGQRRGRGFAIEKKEAEEDYRDQLVISFIKLRARSVEIFSMLHLLFCNVKPRHLLHRSI